jgi:hypothetical protein
MARCVFCRFETDLHDNGIPVCPACSAKRDVQRKPQTREQRIRSVLLDEIAEATARTNAANDVLTSIMSDVPSHLPYPDSAQRIHIASHALREARTAMMAAHRRLNDYLSRGIVPEDVRQKVAVVADPIKAYVR